MSNTKRPTAPKPKKPHQTLVSVGLLDDGHEWAACFGLSYRDLFLHDITHNGVLMHGERGEIRVLSGTGGIAQARNNVVKAFLASRSEWLFFVDTDMGFEGDSLDRLLAVADKDERPVVAGLCFALKGQREHHTSLRGLRYRVVPTIYDYFELEAEGEVGFAPRHDYERDALVEAAATGAAFMLIHRSALETVAAKEGPNWFTPATHPTGDKGEPRTFSEDLSFCVRLAACDIPLYVDTRIKTTHDKGALFLDEETFDRQTGVA